MGFMLSTRWYLEYTLGKDCVRSSAPRKRVPAVAFETVLNVVVVLFLFLFVFCFVF